MSLLDNASLLLTPNAYKASKLYSVIPSNGNGDFTATRATTATRINSSGLVESVALNVPRVDYSLGGCPNILLEPQRTNLALQSSSFDSASWGKTASSVTANSTTSPSGVVDADTLTADGTSARHEVVQSVSVTNGVAYTFSIYAKKGTNNFFQFFPGAASFGSTGWANFDLNAGVVGSVGASTTATITSVGNGWYRCTTTATATFTTSIPLTICLVNSATAPRTQTNTLNTSVFLWGVQYEAGAYATSYIPTTTASVTRNADIISKTGISSLIGQTEGTVFVQFSTNNLETYTRRLFALSDGTNANQMNIQIQLNSTTLTFAVILGGIAQALISTSTNFYTLGNVIKIAIAYKQNDFCFYANGTQIGVDTLGSVPTCSQFQFSDPLNSSQFTGNIKQTAIFPTRLTNAQLAALTA